MADAAGRAFLCAPGPDQEFGQLMKNIQDTPGWNCALRTFIIFLKLDLH